MIPFIDARRVVFEDVEEKPQAKATATDEKAAQPQGQKAK